MMRVRSLSAALTTLAAAVLAVGAGAALAQPQEEAVSLGIPIETFTLENGLRVVLVPDHSSPAVAVVVHYDVGSRDEVPGRTGFAHLFEHMMFEGSANVGKNEHFQHVSRNGGRMNGFTTQDRTVYFEVMPSDRLELALWLESDRMLSLNVTAENFENQREVVKEERRLRVDNQPYVPAYLAFFEMAYDAFQYQHSVIGSMDDLDAAELADVQAFFDLYYSPNNAVLVIAGDVEPARARELVARYFAPLPRGEEPPPVEIVQPPQQGRRESEWDDRLATQPAVFMAWHVPPEPHPDHDALAVLNQILAAGESSRLYDRLVRQDGLAVEVKGELLGRRGPDMLMITSISRGEPAERLRDAILEEVAALRQSGITEDAFASAHQRLVRRTVAAVESNLGRALAIAKDTVYFDEPDRLNHQIERLGTVTREDVQRVLDTYLVDDNLNVMRVQPTPAAQGEGDRAPQDERTAGGTEEGAAP
jgi:zinc protease